MSVYEQVMEVTSITKDPNSTDLALVKCRPAHGGVKRGVARMVGDLGVTLSFAIATAPKLGDRFTMTISEG